jgi:hypothetical protein
MPKELHDKAMKLGASDFGYSNVKGKKYFVVYDGKKLNFGAKGMSDFTIQNIKTKIEDKDTMLVILK